MSRLICCGLTARIFGVNRCSSASEGLRIIPRRRRPLIETGIWLYGAGTKLFQLVIGHDLEGIVAKRKDGPYSASSPWLKIKNPSYSQAEGRGELFNRP